MKHQDVFFHGWSLFSQGRRVTLGALAACALLLSPLVSEAAALTQLGFVKALASYTGATADIGESDADFIQWADDIGVEIDDPNAEIKPQKAAEVIVILKNLNPKKYGGDFVRHLQREGISIPDVITRENVPDIFSGIPLPDLVPSPSPVRGGRPGGKIPPGFLNPRNPHFGTPIDQLPGAQGIANAQNRGNRR